MRCSKIGRVYFTILGVLLPALLFPSAPERIRERDYEAVQEFVNSKRTIPYALKDEYLKINGSIRVNIINRREKLGRENLRGGNTGIPRWDFDSEFNLKMSYKCDKTYAKLRLQSYNSMGIENLFQNCKQNPQGMHGSGRCNDICLRDAWFGYHLCDEKCYYVDIETGRRRLYSIFDSRIQFNERFDGTTVKALRHVSDKSDVFIRGALMIVDYRVNHYVFATEMGIYNFFESGFDFKYSWIRWDKFGTNICGCRDPSGTFFSNSQWSVAYNFTPNILGCNRAKFYGAFLINNDASILATTHSKENIGWYVGFIAGDEELRKPGEWAFDINWQYVEAQAVPDRDTRGIRRGNVRRETFTRDGRGNGNYKGLHIEGVYAITSCLSIDAMYQYSREIENRLGDPHFYSKVEVDFIYSF